MAINKEKKKEILSKLKDAFEKSKSVVFVNFHGLSVKDTTNLRNTLRDSGVSYFVSKKTLVRRALDEAKYDGDVPELQGELALAYTSEDITAPAREVYEFQKKFKDNLQILGGVFDGALKSREEMTEIAQIPSMQTLRGMFVNVINSPIQGLAIAFYEIANKKN